MHLLDFFAAGRDRKSRETKVLNVKPCVKSIKKVALTAMFVFCWRSGSFNNVAAYKILPDISLSKEGFLWTFELFHFVIVFQNLYVEHLHKQCLCLYCYYQVHCFNNERKQDRRLKTFSSLHETFASSLKNSQVFQAISC